MKSEKSEVVHSAEEIASRVRELGEQIRSERGEGEILLLCLLKGAVVFTCDLLRAIPGDVKLEFVDKIQDIADTHIAQATEIDFFSHCDLRGKSVYMIKDVVSTGVIESYLLSHLRLKAPSDLKLVALIDRPDARTMPLEVDYAAFKGNEASIPYVGYGLEGPTNRANLPFIAKG